MRIGGGSAFFNDRLDAAVELVEHGRIDVLMIEALAERTLAILQAGRQAGQPGYFARLPHRLAALLPACAAHGTRLVTNAGGAAPLEAARMARDVAVRAGLRGTTIAAVLGDDVAALVRDADPVLVETGEAVSTLGAAVLSANAYLGAVPIADAVRAGADVIVTGRVTDAALALGPLMASFGWAADDYDALACGTMAGHLLECGGQATGGYFADPGRKEVPGLDRLGFPIAEVAADRSVTITKPPGSGGRIDRHTVTEQLLYEVHDPSAYLTPDVTLDLTDVGIEATGPDQVVLRGARGRPPPGTLKVLIGVAGGIHVEAEISYAGPNAGGRARLAADVLRRRLSRAGAAYPIRFDLIGVDSLWFGDRPAADPPDLRLRVAARVADMDAADALITEVDSLYVNGPAGGGGVRFATRPTVRTLTAYLPASDIPVRIELLQPT